MKNKNTGIQVVQNTTQVSVSPNLSRELKSVIVAKSSALPVRARADESAADIEIKDIIIECFSDSGFKVNTDEGREDEARVILTVIKDIHADFSFLTTKEIALAFRKGLRGKYGDFYGLSVRTFYGWLDSYCSQDRQKAVIEQRAHDIKIAQEKKKEEWENRATEVKMREAIKNIMSAYRAYRDGHEFFIINAAANYTFVCLTKGLSMLEVGEIKWRRIYKKHKKRALLSIENPVKKEEYEEAKNMVNNVDSIVPQTIEEKILSATRKELVEGFIVSKLGKENDFHLEVFMAIKKWREKRGKTLTLWQKSPTKGKSQK